ncbi:MAG TPA: FG-GAP-like repeat-containing protein, partial [Candidatus Limnocylindria bacterium]|nr:FG-GAP-like repeat-containing protein [Candidatus Limnocylindria bacterium]
SIRYWVGTGLGTSNTGVPPKVLLSLEDVDHVGRLDLIVGLNYFQSSLAELLVIRHRVGRLFDGLTDYELADGAGPLAAVDFHATGKHDLLMSRGGHLWRLDSDANGAFAPPADLGFGALARALDFNDDGRTDVLQSAGPPLSISLCDASGALLAPDTYASRFRASGDFDGDGLLDLLGEDSGGMLETLLNDGTGHFDTPNPAAVNLVGASPIGTGDVDGDTHVDLVVARKLFVPNTATVDSLTVLRSQGDGTFTFLANYPLPPRLPQGPEFQSLEEVFVSDLNGDQLLDVIVATKFAARIGVLYVLIGDGAGGFGSATPYDVTPEDPEVALVDADRDGDPDLVVTAHSGEADGRMQVFANRGNGTFVLPYFQGIETYPGRPGEPRHVGQSVVTGDFNADGSPDVAFPYEGYNYTDGIGVFLGRHSDIVTPVLVSLVDATVSAAGVRLEWYGASAGIPAAHVQRRVGDTWSTLATILRDGTGRYVFDDRDVEPGVRYVYRLQLGDGPQALFSEETVVDIPLAATLRLERPTPNPSVGELHVSFTLSSGAPATLEMTDVGGRRVRAVTIASPEPRRYTLDLSRGGRLAPGIYWVRLTQREESAVTRAVVLR